MLRYLLIYTVTLVLFFALDLTWLGLIAKNLYREKLGFILSDKVNWGAAIVFYLLFIAGMQYFAIVPAVELHQWHTAFLNGAILGGLCYATYDLTNMATIANWPLSIAVIDIIWGMALTAACSTGTYFIAEKFLKA